MQWLKNNPQYMLVQDSFIYLGVQSIEKKCEEENILPQVTTPNSIQERYIKILESCTKEIFADFLEIDKLPVCKVIKNIMSPVSGYASLITNPKMDKNIYGYKFRYTILSICIQEVHLKKNTFESAITTYIHELCHTFGGDKSENFSYAITTALEIILANSDIIKKYRLLWDER